jgi:hypothetical protein
MLVSSFAECAEGSDLPGVLALAVWVLDYHSGHLGASFLSCCQTELTYKWGVGYLVSCPSRSQRKS